MRLAKIAEGEIIPGNRQGGTGAVHIDRAVPGAGKAGINTTGVRSHGGAIQNVQSAIAVGANVDTRRCIIVERKEGIGAGDS